MGRGSKGQGWSEKVFPVMRGRAGMGQDKTMQGGDEEPILRPRPAPLPSLCVTLSRSCYCSLIRSLFSLCVQSFFLIYVLAERERTQKQNPQRDSEIDRLRESSE